MNTFTRHHTVLASARTQPKPRQSFLVVIIACSAVVTTATVRAAEAPASQKPAPYPAEMNKKFTDPEVDIKQFVKRFESEARDIYVKRRDITRALGLRPGDAVADIGAGTGLFTQLFAEQVGPKGHRLCRGHRSGIRKVHRRAGQAARARADRHNRTEHADLHGAATCLN